MPVRQSRRGARATACAAGMLGALAAASVNEALAQRPPVLTDPTPTVKNITEFVGDALDDLCEYNPELPICKDDPGLDVGLPDVVHDLCALFPQVCDGEDVPPGSDSLPGNFSLPDVCGALPDLFFCRDDEIPEDWESVGDQICGELPNHPFCGGDGVSSLTDLICASVPDLCFDGLTLPENMADNVIAMCETYPELCSGHSLPEICDTLPNHSLCREICANHPALDICRDILPASPPPPPAPVRPQFPRVDCTVSGPKKKKKCEAKPQGREEPPLCVFRRKGKRCLPTPLNGGTCSAFGKKKLCERVSGCLWSGSRCPAGSRCLWSRKTGSCGQP